jgi:hypothetical protein
LVCEQAHQQMKLGLDHFEGRSQGLHRHALMTMIAYAFLRQRRLGQAGQKKSRLQTASAEPAGRMARRYHSSLANAAAGVMSALPHQPSMKPPVKLPKKSADASPSHDKS